MYVFSLNLFSGMTCADPKGGGAGGPDPPFLNNTGQDPLKNNKDSKFVHHWPANETPFKWRFAGGPKMPCL